MKRIHRILVPLFLLVLALTPATGQDMHKDEKKYAPMPWHLVDHWWDIAEDTPFESLAVDVTISADVPSSVNLYIAPIGLGHLSKTPFYGGIQTQADGYTKKDQKLRTIGPGFLFSMWGERIFEIGSPDVTTYGGMIREYARQKGLRRWLISVSVLTPYLSSLWLALVTPASFEVGRHLIEGLKNHTVVRDTTALDVFPSIRSMGLREAIQKALASTPA